MISSPTIPHQETFTRRTLLWVTLAVPLLVAGAWLITQLHLPVPECGMRRLTGLPCPACGCTRSLLAWTELDFLRAFLLNPLFFSLCIASLISAGWQLLRGRRVSPAVETMPGAKPLPWLPWLTWRLAGILLVLNWLYLCWRLPK